MKRTPSPEYIAQLAARLSDAKAAASRAARAEDTRRKVLLGALLLEALESGAFSSVQSPVILRTLSGLPVLKDRDRAFLARTLPPSIAVFFAAPPASDA